MLCASRVAPPVYLVCPSAIVFSYHGVAQHEAYPLQLAVTPQNFTEQLEIIDEAFDDVLRFDAAQLHNARPSVCLAFDNRTPFTENGERITVYNVFLCRYIQSVMPVAGWANYELKISWKANTAHVRGGKVKLIRLVFWGLWDIIRRQDNIKGHFNDNIFYPIR